MCKVQHNNAMNMEAIELPYMKLLPTAYTLTHAMPKSIGLDLFSPTSVLVPVHDKVLINMGIAFSNSHGLWLNSSQVRFALHHHIHVGAGVVDPNYTSPCPGVVAKFPATRTTL